MENNNLTIDLAEILADLSSTGPKPSFDAVVMKKNLMEKLSRKDLILLCTVWIMRGNNVTKILRTTASGTETNRLRYLARTLGIKDKVDSHNALTLSRILICFPDLSICILRSMKPKEIMGVTYETLQMIHDEFPHEARIVVGAALLPKTLSSEETHKALALFLIPSLKASNVTNRMKEDWWAMENKNKAMQNLKYVLNSFHSKVITDETRKAAAVKFLMVTDDGELKLSAVWEAAGTAALAWLNEIYDFDLTKECDLS